LVVAVVVLVVWLGLEANFDNVCVASAPRVKASARERR
jgi:hypothetical protein